MIRLRENLVQLSKDRSLNFGCFQRLCRLFGMKVKYTYLCITELIFPEMVFAYKVYPVSLTVLMRTLTQKDLTEVLRSDKLNNAIYVL